MWGIQGGLQAFIGGAFSSPPEIEMIYARIFDAGSGETNLGEQFIAALKVQAGLNDSLIAGATIDSTLYAETSHNSLRDIINNPETASEALPLIIIPENFTATYLALNITSNPQIPVVEVYSLPSGGYWDTVPWAVQTVVAQPPFTVMTIEKTVLVDQTTITIKGEESAGGFGIGLMGFMAVMIAVQAPGPFVSTSFAGEREKKTMESLLVLPISRFHILLGKLIAGMVLLAIFAVMNFIGAVVFTALIGTSNAFVAIEPSLTLFILVAVTMFLSAFVNLGIGISIASLAKDVRSAQSMYGLLTLGAMGVGAIGMTGGLPEQFFGEFGIFLYLLPWTHSTALLSKGLFPQTYASAALTGSIATDILLHLGYMVVFIAICLFIASKVFDRESILT
jgi:ABC-type transport system involved in multi-copper enzyme maturation permease subunit